MPATDRNEEPCGSFTHKLTREYMHALQEARRALDEAIRVNEKFDASWDQTKADALRQALSGFSPVGPYSSAVPVRGARERERARARERERERERERARKYNVTQG